MNIFLKLISLLICHDIKKAIKHTTRNIDIAPECHNKPMEYLGEHSGMRMNTQFYQCGECKRMSLLHKRDWEDN